MISIDFSPASVLPDTPLPTSGPLSDILRDQGVHNFRQAALFVQAMPYGYNHSSTDSRILFSDGFGTCLTKHGFMARLAQEVGLAAYRFEGFYALDETVVHGVDDILREYGLPYIPRTHCFLGYEKLFVDLTAGNCTGKNGLITRYLEIFRVPPEQSPAEAEAAYRGFYSSLCEQEPVFARMGVIGMLEVLRLCQEQNKALCRRK